MAEVGTARKNNCSSIMHLDQKHADKQDNA